jgi:HSP20 family protein
LTAERQQRETSKSDGGFRSEFRYGSFQRTLSLPKGCTAADVSATYRDGILEVTVPVPVSDTEVHKVAVTKA